MTDIVLVAAIGENNVIGRAGKLPWRLKSELQHFKRLTLNRPVVMGRKTFDSIGRPLPDRTNIVVTRDLARPAKGGVLALGIDAAIAMARKDAALRGVDEIMIIGGSDIFEATFPLATRLEITHVHASPAGDTYFPPVDPQVWKSVSRSEHAPGPEEEYGYTTAVYRRR